ncbi:MAG: hypothetical protein CMB99_02285 [Flavobacteriaceae bacterium]|nr:hypothetical protein [Flavobacteriaceae bacterium]|tara:strand:+ start:21268 stop:23163 length:1896 start_codon:yes stop_codon:yes gene_type:complete
MKKSFLLLLTILSLPIYSQEKRIKTTVEKATVFLNSARISRVKNVQLKAGKNEIAFTNLSPFIDNKSIQIKASDIEIEGIDFRKNFLQSEKKKKDIEVIKINVEQYEKAIKDVKVKLDINKEKIDFLVTNRRIASGANNVNVKSIVDAFSFYGKNMSQLKREKLTLTRELNEINRKLVLYRKSINDLTQDKNYGSGEIFVKLNSKTSKQVKFEVSYNIDNVSWYPSYDVRVKDINSPLQLIFKANLKQQSKIDWKNVRLSFSSANPDNSSKLKKVIPYFINYGTYPPSYQSSVESVSGSVSDESGGLPGVSIQIKGTTIGTETDFDGNYSIEIPEGRQTLVFSYLGYITTERAANRSNINVIMEESDEALDEVVVTGYGINSNKKAKRNRSRKNQRRNLEKSLQGKVSGVTIRGQASINNLQTREVSKQTTVSFDVVKPYSIKSSNKDVSIPIKTVDVNASYQYFSFPKVSKNAYLIAKLKDWESLNLLEGEANIYFEDTFIGTNLLTTRNANENLEISLGTDKNVIIERKKVENFTTKQFIGNKQEVSKLWNFSIKNNKAQSIKLIVSDQIPISTNEEIRVNLDTDITKGQFNKLTGEIRWKLNIVPKAIENFKLKYSVRFPKNRILNID